MVREEGRHSKEGRKISLWCKGKNTDGLSTVDSEVLPLLKILGRQGL